MGDRTSVTLTVLNEHTAKVREIASDFDEEFPGGIQTNCIQYHDVNYGTLDFLPALETLGIAYESAWDNGCEYGAGTRYCRFTPEGAIDTKEVYVSERNPDIDKLMARIDNPVQLIQDIKLHYESVTPLSWDNQAEYGRKYAALNLIIPKNQY
jgi:hypothetical protein